jgi:hypothetical protein
MVKVHFAFEDEVCDGDEYSLLYDKLVLIHFRQGVEGFHQGVKDFF